MAEDLRRAQHREGYNILVIFLLMLLLNVVLFVSMYIIVFKPFEFGSDKAQAVGPIYKLDTFIVDVGSIDMRRGCRADVALELKDNKTLAEVQRREPEIRSVIINVLRLRTLELLRESNDTTALQSVITEELNKVLGEGKVKTTWFTDFIVD